MEKSIITTYIQLVNRWNFVKTIWDDKISDYFYQTYILPLNTDVKTTQDKLDKLVKALKETEDSIK